MQPNIKIGGVSGTVQTAAVIYTPSGSVVDDPNNPQMTFIFSAGVGDVCTALKTNTYDHGIYYADIELLGPPTGAGTFTNSAGQAGDSAWDAGATVASYDATSCYDNGTFTKFVTGTVTLTTLGNAQFPLSAVSH